MKEAERIAKETADYGSKIHLICEYYDLQKEKEVEGMIKEDDSLLPFLTAWSEFTDMYIKKWVAIEKIIWSDELGVAGKVDRIDEFRGDNCLSIHDLKTGALSNEIGIKLAGYKIMWNEMVSKKIRGVGKKRVDRYSVVQLSRLEPGILRVKEYTDIKYENKLLEICNTYRQLGY